MKRVHLAAVDLNLLVVLDELLRAGSATTAARRLGRTQSAVSHALARLRRLLGDPLFVRAGPALRPTPFAEALRPALRELLERATALVSGTAAGFDPARVDRVFAIAGTDYFELAALPRLLPRLRREAPGVDVHTRFAGDDIERAILSGEVDLAFGTRFRTLAGIATEPLGEDRLVCVLRRGHPRARGPWGLDAYVALDHAVVTPRGLPGSAVDDALAPLGRQRRVVLRLPHFVAALHVVAGTDLACTVPSHFARALARALPLTLRELPFDPPRFVFALGFSSANASDPAHRWFRDLVRDAYGLPHER